MSETVYPACPCCGGRDCKCRFLCPGMWTRYTVTADDGSFIGSDCCVCVGTGGTLLSDLLAIAPVSNYVQFSINHPNPATFAGRLGNAVGPVPPNKGIGVYDTEAQIYRYDFSGDFEVTAAGGWWGEGSRLTFNGSTHVDADPTGLPTSGPYAISFWAKPTAFGGDGRNYAVSWGTDGVGNSVSVGIDSNQTNNPGVNCWVITNNSASVVGSVEADLNVAVHVVVVCDGADNFDLYLDTVHVNSGTLVTVPTEDYFAIGRIAYASLQPGVEGYFQGQIWDVRIHAMAQVTDHAFRFWMYNQGKTFCYPQNAVRYYQLNDEAFGGTTWDQAGVHDAHGTVVGAGTWAVTAEVCGWRDADGNKKGVAASADAADGTYPCPDCPAQSLIATPAGPAPYMALATSITVEYRKQQFFDYPLNPPFHELATNLGGPCLWSSDELANGYTMPLFHRYQSGSAYGGISDDYYRFFFSLSGAYSGIPPGTLAPGVYYDADRLDFDPEVASTFDLSNEANPFQDNTKATDCGLPTTVTIAPDVMGDHFEDCACFYCCAAQDLPRTMTVEIEITGTCASLSDTYTINYDEDSLYTNLLFAGAADERATQIIWASTPTDPLPLTVILFCDGEDYRLFVACGPSYIYFPGHEIAWTVADTQDCGPPFAAEFSGGLLQSSGIGFCSPCGGAGAEASSVSATVTGGMGGDRIFSGPPPPGVGKELEGIFKSLGFPKGCRTCGGVARKMDQMGVDWCVEHRGEIVEHLRKKYAATTMKERFKAAVLAVKEGVAFRINPLDPAPGLFDEAVRRARAKQGVE